MTPGLATLPSPRSWGGVFWNLLKLSFPLILSNFFLALQFTIDRTMLAWADSDMVAAAFSAAMIFWVPLIGLSGTAGFCMTFVAQYIGAGRPRRVGPVVNQALYFSLVSGLMFIGLVPWAYDLMAWTGHSPTLITLEGGYFACLCFAALPMMVCASVTGFLAGRGDTWSVIWINAVGTLVNVALDWVLIFGLFGFPKLGIVGAGWATVAGCTASACVALALYLRPQHDRDYAVFSGWRFDYPLFRQLMKFGVPSGLQGSFDVLAWTFFTLMLGWIGDAPLAASSLVFNVNATFMIPMLGMAQGVCVWVGQHLGEDKPDHAERGVWAGFMMAGGFMTIMGIVVACTPDFFLRLYASTDNLEKWAAVAALVPTLLIFVAIYSFFDSMNLIYAFALRGAGDTRFVTLATIAIGTLFLVVPTYLVVRPGEGLILAWIFCTVYICALAVTFLVRFIWGPWRGMRVIESVPLEPS